MDTIDRKKLTESIENNRLTMAYIPDDKTNIELVLKHLDDNSNSGKKIYISTDRSPTNYTGNIDIKTPEDIGVDFVIDKELHVEERTLINIRKILQEYDYIFIGEIEKLCEILMTDNTKKRSLSRSKIIETFKAITFGENIGKLVVITQKPDVKHIMGTTSKTSGVSYVELNDIPKEVSSLETDKKPQDSLTEEDFITDKAIVFDAPKVNIWRIDSVIANNKATYGQLMFFADKEEHRVTRYAIDAVITTAPISEQICHISPFRSKKELKQSLLKLNTMFPLTLRSLERTTIHTVDSLNSVDLNNRNALMDMIVAAILNFKKKLNKLGHDRGICIIDTLDIDTYCAEIDHPTLKWYAKSNNIFIIVGAQAAEERFTYQRQKFLEKRSNYLLPNP